jgi:tRNA threonylcarbamoyladenosine modification (KEOPS) complex Cgi121 subunit
VHKAITIFIVKPTLLGEVIASIDLDDQFFFSAIEVSNINADCMLSAELLVASAAITEQLP